MKISIKYSEYVYTNREDFIVFQCIDNNIIAIGLTHSWGYVVHPSRHVLGLVIDLIESCVLCSIGVRQDYHSEHFSAFTVCGNMPHTSM